MSLTVQVVGHIERERQAVELAASLDATLWLDDGSLGVYGNHRRALTNATGTHVCVLEDDALPCRDLLARVTALIDQRPDHLLGLYVGRQRPVSIQADIARAIPNADGDWLPLHTDTLRWAVGYVIPTSDVSAAIEHADKLTTWAADRRIGAWHGQLGRLSYSWPSLVDHADGPSLSREHGARARGRVAWAVADGGGERLPVAAVLRIDAAADPTPESGDPEAGDCGGMEERLISHVNH